VEKNVVWVRQVASVDAVRRWTALVRDVFGGASVAVNFSSNIAGLMAQLPNGPATTVVDHGNLAPFLSLLESVPALQIDSMQVSANDRTLTYNTADTGFGKITITPGQQPQQWIPSLLSSITKNFEMLPYPQLVAEVVPKMQMDGIRLQEQLLSSLSAEVSKVGKHVLEQQDRFASFMLDTQKQLDAHRQRLEEEDRKRQAEAEAVRKQHDEEHRARVEALQQRESEYDEKVRELKLGAATTERRGRVELLTGWLQNQQEFNLSAKTDEKRKPVERACQIAMTIGLLMVSGFAARLLWTPDWKFVPGVTAGFAIVASTFIYYIRWSNQW
jgi:hypothetical protein